MYSSSLTSRDDDDLKIRELLKEVEFDYSSPTAKSLDHAISAIKLAINSIPQHTKVGADEAPGFIRDICVPSPEKIAFAFRTPASIDVAGSYSIRSIVRQHVNVDLLLQLPKECFHEKDYLNHRYHAKRCLYLCVIHKHLKACSAVRKIEWSTFQDEGRKPILIIYPVLQQTAVDGVFIRLIPSATSLFDITKLSLARNNVRAVNQGTKTEATPKYSCSILEDMFLEENAAFIKEVYLGWRDLQGALVLLKVLAWPTLKLSRLCLADMPTYIVPGGKIFEAGENDADMELIQPFRFKDQVILAIGSRF